MKRVLIGSWCAALLCGVLMFAPVAEARFARPQLIPTERLIKNTEAFLVENPDDAQAYFTLARIHYLTFRNRAMLVHSYSFREDPSKLPSIPPDYRIFGSIEHELAEAEAKKRAGEDADYKKINEEKDKLKAEGWKPNQISSEQALKHAAEAEVYFKKAITADPENALYFLGSASLREEIGTYLTESSSKYPTWKGSDDEETAITIQKYFRAYELAIDEDLKRTTLPLSGLKSMIGHEAAEATVRLMGAHPELAKKLDEIDTDAIQRNVEKLKTLRRGAITPIIISMTGNTAIKDAVTMREVHFDVDGDGIKERINSWPNADTGILVWDQNGTGQIESGTQLFGTYTFKMIWRNGFEPLDALDDSRDQRLSGAELPGLAVWFDKNGNAISEPGEVRKVSEMGISEIAVRPTDVVDGVLTNSEGVRFLNEKTAATLDWLFDVVE